MTSLATHLPAHTPLRGEVAIPGDKSISHRAILFGALANGVTKVTHFLQGADCLSTIDCLRKLGVPITQTPECVLVHGRGLHGLCAPAKILDVGNSGTTMRLIAGILAGQPFSAILDGDASIRRRPMERILDPLSLMNADIASVQKNGCAPLAIHGKRNLRAIHYQSPVASAQVKSCVLLAGLYADNATRVTEPYLSRNHTELMLAGFGARVAQDGTTATIWPEPSLHAMEIDVPGDISSAAYFLAAALIVPGSELLIKNVGVNPTRDGILRVAKEMGADITLCNKKESGGEPTADILVRPGRLRAVEIGGDLIPALIDELPILAVLACFCDGTTVIRDAAELKFKESNRIDAMVQGLSAMGARVEATDDGMAITGGMPLHGARVDSHQDHRVAMSLCVAALGAAGETRIEGADCVRISYPGFYDTLRSLGVSVQAS